MIEFIWPQTIGEWLAWSSALALLIFGLWMFIMPRTWLKWTNLQTKPGKEWAIAQYRGPTGGMMAGFGFAILMLHPQPLLYIALGFAMGGVAFGRLFSIVVDKGSNFQNWAAFIIEALMAFFPLAYAFGLIH